MMNANSYDADPISSSPPKLTWNSLKKVKTLYSGPGDTSRSDLVSKKHRKHHKEVDPIRNAVILEREESSANVDDNLQKLKKRIKKLSKRVVQAEKKNLVKLYENPAKVARSSDHARPGSAPVDIVEELRKIRLAKDKRKVGLDDQKASRGKKWKKRKKAATDRGENASTSSSSVKSCDSVAFHSDLPKSRKPDILRLIKEKEEGVTHAGDESDIDTDVPFPPIPKKSLSFNKISSRYSAMLSSIPSSATSFVTLNLKKPVAKISTTKHKRKPEVENQYSTSLANIFDGIIDVDNTPSASVPGYLEQTKSPRKKSKNKITKKNQSVDNEKEKPSSPKAAEESKNAKSALKKTSTSKKQNRREHVLFTESPEVISGKESTSNKNFYYIAFSVIFSMLG